MKNIIGFGYIYHDWLELENHTEQHTVDESVYGFVLSSVTELHPYSYQLTQGFGWFIASWATNT